MKNRSRILAGLMALTLLTAAGCGSQTSSTESGAVSTVSENSAASVGSAIQTDDKGNPLNYTMAAIDGPTAIYCREEYDAKTDRMTYFYNWVEDGQRMGSIELNAETDLFSDYSASDALRIVQKNTSKKTFRLACGNSGTIFHELDFGSGQGKGELCLQPGDGGEGGAFQPRRAVSDLLHRYPRWRGFLQ